MLKSLDRIKELTSTSGTGALTLTGAESGFQAFSVLGNGTKCYYTITDVNTIDFEVGEGTYNSNTLTRDAIFESSNSGNAISLSATGSTVFVTYPAEKSSYRDIGVNRDYEASGSVGAGKPLILNADNTVSQVAETPTTIPAGLGTKTTTELASSIYDQQVAMGINGQFVSVYRQGNDFMCQVNTVSSDDLKTITHGTSQLTFNLSSSTDVGIIYQPDANKYVLFYKDSSSYLTGSVMTVSGTGSSATLATATAVTLRSTAMNGSPNNSNLTYDTSSDLLIACWTEGSSPKTVSMPISGTTISANTVGSVPIYGSFVNAYSCRCAYSSTANKVVYLYADNSTEDLYTTVGTVSGSSFSFGSTAIVSNLPTGNFNGADACVGVDNNGVVVLSYLAQDITPSYTLFSQAGTLSGTTITWGSPSQVSNVTCLSNATNECSIAPIASGKMIIARATRSDSPSNADKGIFAIVTSSGTTVSNGSVQIFSSTASRYPCLAVNYSKTQAVINWGDSASMDMNNIVYLESQQTGGAVTNLTNDNYFGVASSTNTESVSFTITVQNVGGSNYYYVNGVRQQMPIALKKGSTYKFIQSDSSNSNHPLRFSTTSDGTWGGGTEYTSGVTVVGTAGQSGSYTQIVVADTTPSQLYSYCTNHSGMGFGISIISQPVGVNRAGSFNNDQTGMTAGKDMYVSSAGLIKERTTTTTTPDTNPSFNFQEATSNSTSTNPTSTYEATSGAYVIAWKESSNGYGYVMAGTISNGTMTWGTPTAFLSSLIDDVPNICSGDGAVHITYRSGTNGVIKWGTISGTTITLAGGGDLFNHGGSYSSPMGYRCAYDTANNYVMVFYSGGSGTQTAYVQPMYYNSSAGSYTGSTSSIVKSSIQILTTTSEIVYDSDTERFVVFYRDTTNSNVGYANVIQSTGSSASPTASVGSASQFTNGDQIVSYGNIGGVYDTQNDKIFIAWNNTDGSNPSWRGAIITVTGGATNTIASNGWADIWDYAGGGSTAGITFDSDKNKIMFYYRDDGNSDYLTYKTITSGASSFTVADGSVIKESDNQFQGNSPSFAPSKGVVLPTRDLGNSSKISSVTTYFGSTTSTVVNGSQFVGVARSGSDLELSEPPTELVAMANGSITKGKPVIIKTDGDFEQVKETSTTTSTTETIGTEIQLSNGETTEFETAHNNNGTFLVVYKFQTTGRLHARLGTYSSSGVISWGTDLTLTKPVGGQQATACYYDSDNDCFVAMGGTGTNEYMYATILTYSGTALTEGNFVEFRGQNSNTNGVSDMSASYDTTNKIAYVVVSPADSITKLTVSGTSITASAFEYVFGSYGSRMQYASLDYDIPNNRGVIYFRDETNNYYPTVVAFTSASGTLTFGTKVVLISVQYGLPGSVAHNLTHTFVAYGNSSDRSKVYYNNLSISGTSITVGTQAVLITSSNITNMSSKPFIYNPDGKFYYLFSQTSSPYNLSLVEATASGTSLSGSFKFQQSHSSLYEKWAIGNTSVSNPTMILVGYDSGNTDADALTFTPTATITTITNNLLSNNFIGFAQNTVADNEDVKVKVISESDANQTGLTTASQYYVQVDGTLSTTAGTPSVLGGTALSSTKILIKS